MKKTTLILLLSLMGSIALAQVSSVITSKTDEVSNKHKKFIVVDQATGYALGKEVKKYEKSGENPMCYFTTVPLTETGLTTVRGSRIMGIFDASSSPDARWNVQYNEKEDKVSFGRSRFVAQKFNALWTPMIDGYDVVFRTLQGGNGESWTRYLAIGEDGTLKRVKTFDEASRWSLIYHK